MVKTPDWLTQIRGRAEKATEGPWIQEQDPDVWNGPEFGVEDYVLGRVFVDKAMIQNCDFIAHSRTDIPLMLSKIEGLVKALEWYERELCSADRPSDKVAREALRSFREDGGAG